MPPQKDRIVNFIVGPTQGGQNHLGEDGEVHMTGVRIYTPKTSCNRLTRIKTIAVIAVCLVMVLTACLLVSLIGRQNNPCVGPGSRSSGNQTNTDEVWVTPKPAMTGLELTTPSDGNVPISNPLWQTFRLPTALKPLHYELELRTDISANTFAGALAIHFLCHSPTRFILLHSSGLNIVSIELDEATSAPDGETREGSAPKLTGDPEFYTPFHFMTLTVDEQLQKGQIYILRIKYYSDFSNNLGGLYVSEYKTKQGKAKYIVASFLSPNGARHVFPCFDEPAFKANYTITIVHPDGYQALSNMPELRREAREEGWNATYFQTTPKMSTYLVAFVVCDFWRKSRTVDNTVFSVWAREEVFNDTAFALEYGTQAFRFLEAYSGLEYPLPKMGGMENWGLLIFRESYMLLNPDETPSKKIQEVATVIAHEIAHQWYSNLVTQEYWGELWLKESFANLLAHLALDHIYPNQKMMDELSLAGEEFLRVMELDAQPTSHAVQPNIDDISAILNNFDLTSYYKSEAIVRMLRYVLGQDLFQSGLTKFLQKRAYGNVKATDLWDALSVTLNHTDASFDLNITAFMNPWIMQMGYPVITLTRDYQTRIVQINQAPFFLQPVTTECLPPSPYGYQWQIPIMYSYEDQITQPKMFILAEESASLSRSDIGPDQWIVANSKRTGFFRTNYDETNWNMIIKQLLENHEVISAADRAMLIDDAFHLATAGRLSITVALNLTRYLTKEREYVPWKVTLEILGYVSRMLSFTSAFGNLKKYILQQLLPVYKEIGWNETNSHQGRLLQMEVLEALCFYGNEDCASIAKNLFLKHLQQGTKVPPNFRNFVYLMGVANGDDTTRDYAWQQYRKGLPGERQQWLRALAATSEPWVLSRYMERSLNESLVRRQDTVEVFKFAINNPIGGYLAWNFFRQHWDILKERYAKTLFHMNQIIDAVTQWFNTDFHLKELQDFVASKENELAGKAGLSNFRQAEEMTEVNIRWMKNNYKNVKQWLEEAVSGG
ncbi:aminopeptidase Ey-like isoform X2 [Acanthaster planci]|uniref:Aminopeptidase Ey-like isoform X2 n=1 Tax=Acanthaster planci TaxID=133434 RepID=A0A8B7XP66_ACAPL|nr:aminopeptidase Ey-like isoform X2 [Acanthaster planci]